MERRYPDWICSAIVEDLLPWQQSTSMSLSDFHAKYTLHDSYWIGMFQDVGFDGDVIMAFQWDLVWTPEEIKRQVGTDDWPYIFIRLTKIEGTQTIRYKSEEFSCLRGVGDVEEESIEGIRIFSVNDFLGGSVSVSYKGSMQFLALTQNGKQLEI